MSEAKYDRVSEKNPALVLFVIDVSESMRDSKALDHVIAAIEPLKNMAASKPGQIRLAVIAFDTSAELILDVPLEEAPDLSKISMDISSIDSRTNLKKAAELAKQVYNRHVDRQCNGKFPLASILFFTDGGHSYDVDIDWQGVKNRWFDVNIDDFLDYPGNVICGVIDYSPLSGSSDFPDSLDFSRNKISKITRLSRELVDKAYSRETSHPTLPSKGLESIFGPRELLYDKLFSVGVRSVEKSPATTSAFVRLGTYSSTQSVSNKDSRPSVDLNFDNEFD